MAIKLAKKIKYLRMEKNLFQEELAQELDVAAVTVTGWENGYMSPGKENTKRLRDFFGERWTELKREDFPKIEKNFDRAKPKTIIKKTEDPLIMEVKNDINLGSKVKYLRTKNNLTQEELAEKLGWKGTSARISVSHLETGYRNPGKNKVEKLISIFGRDVWEDNKALSRGNIDFMIAELKRKSEKIKMADLETFEKKLSDFIDTL